MLNATPGSSRLLSWEEETQLVDHIKDMEDIGYGYTESEVQYIATDYCQSLDKSAKVKRMRRSGTEAIRTQIQAQNPKRLITRITNSDQ